MQSRIEWTDATWNPVTGCTKISPGCAHCYAETVANRFWATQYPYVGPLDVQRPRQFSDVQCHEDRLAQPLRWRRPRRIFVSSMGDVFHEQVAEAEIEQIFAVMMLARQHQFQILTKRAERLESLLTEPGRASEIAARASAIAFDVWPRRGRADRMPATARLKGDRATKDENEWTPEIDVRWPLPNVWLGVSVENQDCADARIPLLLQTPAAVRFISCEPLLGPVDLATHLGTALNHDGLRGLLNWVIVGGESGQQARRCDLAWIRSILSQCRAASVPCFVKQLGTWPASAEQQDYFFLKGLTDGKGCDPAEWPMDLRVREYPVAHTMS